MVDVNWELLRFKYEVLEHSIKDLAVEHQLSESVLKYAAEKWVQVPLEERKSEEDIQDGIKSDVVEQAKIFSLLKQKFLNPKYIELEATLLHKAIEVASKIDPNTQGSAKIIQMLTDTLKNLLLEQRAILGEGSGQGETRTWEINIVDSTAEEDAKTSKTERPEKISAIRDHQKAL